MTTRTTPRLYTYIVQGNDQFPVDMMRHDRSCPKRETDSAEIERSFQPRSRGLRRVTLIGPNAPNEPRWGSFGWAVESVE